MIKLFRKIRQTMIKDLPAGKAGNKVSKYLLYAIGEIILVVIGILIALSINNWNDTKKQHRADIEFLNNLKDEIISDTLAISFRTKLYNDLNENIRTALILIDTAEVLNKEETKLISRVIIQAEYLLPVQGELSSNGLTIASGSLKRLNQDLHSNYLDYLKSFELSYDLTTSLSNSLGAIINNELYPSVDLNFTDRTKNPADFNLITLKNNRSVNNALQKSIYYRSTFININKRVLTSAKSLIEQIDNILNNE